eukprot:325867_1
MSLRSRTRFRQPNTTECTYLTPLVAAIYKKHAAIAALLLTSEQFDLYPFYSHESIKTFLHLAVESREIDTIRLLLSHPKIDMRRERRAFQDSIKTGVAELLTLFLEHEKFDDLLLDRRYQYLHVACASTLSTNSSGTTSLRVLLDSGKFNINDKSTHGLSALNFCAANNCEAALKIVLSRKDLDINSPGSSGELTALHVACCKLNTKIVRLLLADDRIDPNLLNQMNQTPLILAVQQEHLELVEALMDCEKVDVNFRQPLVIDSTRCCEVRVSAGRTALHWAVLSIEDQEYRQYSRYRSDYSTQVKIVRALISAGADVLAHTCKGESPRDVSNDDAISE